MHTVAQGPHCPQLPHVQASVHPQAVPGMRGAFRQDPTHRSGQHSHVGPAAWPCFNTTGFGAGTVAILSHSEHPNIKSKETEVLEDRLHRPTTRELLKTGKRLESTCYFNPFVVQNRPSAPGHAERPHES